MTADEFRNLALSLPETSENEHMGHPDFRVSKKIFATLSPSQEDWGMVKLKPEEQAVFVQSEPKAFQPFNGAWGKMGCTKVILAAANGASVRQALMAAWRNTAAKKLLKKLEEE